MVAMMGAKGASMMEDGLNKLAKVTPKFDNLGPRLSGAAPKTSLTDSLFGLPPSDDKMPALGNKKEEWIPVHFKTTDDQSRATKQEQANLCAVTVLCAST